MIQAKLLAPPSRDGRQSMEIGDRPAAAPSSKHDSGREQLRRRRTLADCRYALSQPGGNRFGTGLAGEKIFHIGSAKTAQPTLV
jgi:hypothetical protein